MPKIGQQLFCIKTVTEFRDEVIPCTYIGEVHSTNGTPSGKYTVRLPEDDILATLYYFELFETEKEAVDSIIKMYEKRISDSTRYKVKLEADIKEWEESKQCLK